MNTTLIAPLPTVVATAAARLATLEATIITPAGGRPRHTCTHCHKAGTTLAGGLWRVSLTPGCDELYYLHSACLASYKAAHDLRSVEGRLPCATPHPRPRLARRSTSAAPVTPLADRSAAS